MLRQSSTRLNVQMPTVVGVGVRGAATLHRTSVTVSSPSSVENSRYMPPPSTNLSIGPTSRTACSVAPSRSRAATMRHTLLVSDASSRIRPVPVTVAVTSTSGTVVQRCQ